MPEIIDAAYRYKNLLASREANAMGQMATRWLGVMRQMDKEILAIADTMARRRAAGLEVTVGYLYRTERYQVLLQQAYKEFAKYESYAGDLIARNQDLFGKLGRQHALGLLDIMEPGLATSLEKLTVGAVENIVGFTASGSPLNALLAEAWPQAIQQTTAALVNGVALGYGARRIAKMMNQGMSSGLYRSMVIARTETHRAYRQNKIDVWSQSGMVDGFQRVATHDRRVCPACLFAEGEFIPLGRQLAEHPQGRCIMVPCKSRRDRHEWLSGEDWFEKQPAATQRSILGRGRYEAWKAGQIDLQDIPAVVDNDVWGPSLRARGLRELTGGTPIPRRLPQPPPQPPPPPIPDPADFLDLDTATVDDLQVFGEFESWAANRWGHIRFEFAGADVEALRPTMRQFEKLAKKYPKVVERLNYIGTNPTNTFGNEFAHATTDGTEIGLNPAWYGDAKKYSDELAGCLQRNWLDADGTIESVMTHEFGHQVENWLMDTRKAFAKYAHGDGLGIVGETVRLFNLKFSPTTKLSRYSITTNSITTAPHASSAANKVEGWAEAFAAIEHKPKKEWPIYVKRMDKLINTIGDTDTWQDPLWLRDLQRGTDERERAVEYLADLRKRLELER